MSTAILQSRLYVALKVDPDFIAKLTPLQKLLAARVLSARPDQILPKGIYVGLIAGRGWGKSYVIAKELNRLVACGRARHIALVAQNEQTTREVCVAWLIETSPPWFKAIEDRGGVLWPNGARAYVYSAEVADVRGQNFDHAWLTEIAFWPRTTGDDCFTNVTTAVRKGNGRVFWDTTSKGKPSALLKRVLKMHETDPVSYPVVRGTIFDNEFYRPEYLRTQWLTYSSSGAGTRRRDEELLGAVHAEAEGALWQQAWIDDNRVATPPENEDVRIVSLDPAVTDGTNADAFGFVVAARVGAEVYILKDRTKVMGPQTWAPMVIAECLAGAAGVVLETTGNSGGQMIAHAIRAEAREHGLEVRDWPDDGSPMPRRVPGVVYVRQVKARANKETRAYPAALYAERGHVHHVGEHNELEHEMTTWVPGVGKSPNRLDAAAQAINDLSGLGAERPAETVEQAINTAHDAHAALRSELARRSGKRTVL